ncbi:MAG: site-specific DNA-methyltransferase [Planctomycetaceae bacterium]|jgi:adenine-specific DNA-methyltransferase|nr:site-specific DNA-methyltransferase [Planctomycetaceae bacterium]
MASLVYSNVKNGYSAAEPAHKVVLPDKVKTAENLLIHGENLTILKYLCGSGYAGKIDLVYIDPPFATGNTFRKGTRSATVSSSIDDEIAYIDNQTGKEFLDFLRERLIVLKKLLSDSGSLYLHIDYKIGHYVKVMMDEVFGIENFRNDITRIKCNPKNFQRKGYSNFKDLILFYTKSENFVWNEPLAERNETEIAKLFSKIDANGRRYTTNPLHAPGETRNGVTGKEWKGIKPPAGRHWRYAPSVLDELESQGLIEWSANGVPRKIIYADDYEQKRMQDIWEFKDPQHPDYPTQKNLEMLELILRTSSNADSIVLDCFCGSGTTLVAANNLNRCWIGIDQSGQAIETAKKRLDDGGLFSSNYRFIRGKCE